MSKTLWQIIQEAETEEVKPLSQQDIAAMRKYMQAVRTKTPAPIAAVKTHLYTTGEYELYEFLENCEYWEVGNKGAQGWFQTAGVTMGASKIEFYYDKDFIDSLAKQPGKLIFLIAHEASHILRFHHDRSVAARQEAGLANTAQDMIINDDILRTDKVAGWKPEMIEGGMVIPDKFHEDFKDAGRKAYYSENMYNWLNANPDEKKKSEGGAPGERDYFQEGSIVRVDSGPQKGEYRKITKDNGDGTYETEQVDIEKEIEKVKGS